jgi:hypothetical protein
MCTQRPGIMELIDGTLTQGTNLRVAANIAIAGKYLK